MPSNSAGVLTVHATTSAGITPAITLPLSMDLCNAATAAAERVQNTNQPKQLLERITAASRLSHFITEDQMLAAFDASTAQPLRCPRTVPVPAKIKASNAQENILDDLANNNRQKIADLESQHERDTTARHDAAESGASAGAGMRRSQRVIGSDRRVLDLALQEQQERYEQEQEHANEVFRGFVPFYCNSANMHHANCTNKGTSAVVDGCNCQTKQLDYFPRFWCGRAASAHYDEATVHQDFIGAAADTLYIPPPEHANIMSHHADFVHFNKTPYNSPASPTSPVLGPNIDSPYDADEDV
jgi:hypothetical protein